NVFARGPAGKNDAALVDLSQVEAVKVTVGPEETRLTVRDREALPWIDAHTEAGATREPRIPAPAAHGGASEQLPTHAAGPGRWQLPTTPGPAVALASLQPVEQVAAARGPDSQLRMLFAEPFGPGSMMHVDLWLVPDQQTFGVSQEDGERMDLL